MKLSAKSKQSTRKALQKKEAKGICHGLKLHNAKARIINTTSGRIRIGLLLPDASHVLEAFEGLKHQAKELRKLRKENQQLNVLIECANTRIENLETIMAGAGVEVPKDPPPEKPGPKGDAMQRRVSGSFESGKRR